jgi:hypothetical protein
VSLLEHEFPALSAYPAIFAVLSKWIFEEVVLSDLQESLGFLH